MRSDYILPDYLFLKYRDLKSAIKNKLQEFSSIPENKYFYELCYCICTPQTKAKNALIVQKILEEKDFFNHPFDASKILSDSGHYIRFHNQKAQRLLLLREQFNNILNILKSDKSNDNKRITLIRTVNGFGMKEGSHFLRNIGYKGFAILDRHTLKHLKLCGVIDEKTKVNNVKSYLFIEEEFRYFSHQTNISLDELDLLFWSYETGIILK